MKDILKFALLAFIVIACNEDCNCDTNPKLGYTLDMDEFAVTARPKDAKQFTAFSELEIWAAPMRDEQLPIPGGFNYLDDRSQNFGDYIQYAYKQAFYNKFGVYIDEVRDKGKYIYFQARLKNENGFSEFETYAYKIGDGLTKVK